MKSHSLTAARTKGDSCRIKVGESYGAILRTKVLTGDGDQVKRDAPKKLINLSNQVNILLFNQLLASLHSIADRRLR